MLDVVRSDCQVPSLGQAGTIFLTWSVSATLRVWAWAAWRGGLFHCRYARFNSRCEVTVRAVFFKSLNPDRTKSESAPWGSPRPHLVMGALT